MPMRMKIGITDHREAPLSYGYGYRMYTGIWLARQGTGHCHVHAVHHSLLCSHALHELWLHLRHRAMTSLVLCMGYGCTVHSEP